MSSRRIQRMAEAVRESVSQAILTELRDPRVRQVTVTRTEVSGDLRHAKVYVSIMGSETEQQLCLRGLRHAAGFLQAKLADRVKTRYTPVLKFVLDKGIKHSIRVSSLIDQVSREVFLEEAAHQHIALPLPVGGIGIDDANGIARRCGILCHDCAAARCQPSPIDIIRKIAA